jgi:ATP-dependent protease ClpP protease subunit
MKAVKKICLVMVTFFAATTFAFADPGHRDAGVEDEKAVEIKSIMQCQHPDPKRRVWGKLEDCLKCHTTPNFKVKEANPGEGYDLPFGTELILRDGKLAAHYLMDSISPNQLWNFFEWANRHENIKTTIVEIQSPGGSVFDGLRCAGIIRFWWPRFNVETHLNGMAFSMGFVIMQAGEKRLVAPYAQGMAHELWSIAFLKIETPANLEDEAHEYRRIQTNLSELMIERTKLSLEEMEEKIRKRNWWVNGREMVELGFADGFIYAFATAVGDDTGGDH